ncbi:MAG TPA: ATP-binding protein, partial [Lachnospiraceae bacterium]|nr:ATP-binding protein [Lachnospiraceae bacterium]
MRKGGVSDPRNKTLMKMFNLINIGERAGSGVPNIFNVWEDEGWIEPAKKSGEKKWRKECDEENIRELQSNIRGYAARY